MGQMHRGHMPPLVRKNKMTLYDILRCFKLVYSGWTDVLSFIYIYVPTHPISFINGIIVFMQQGFSKNNSGCILWEMNLFVVLYV